MPPKSYEDLLALTLHGMPVRCRCGQKFPLQISFVCSPETGPFHPEVHACPACRWQPQLCLDCEHRTIPGGWIEVEIGGSDLGRSYGREWAPPEVINCPHCANTGILGMVQWRDGPPCRRCQGQGHVSCSECNGDGRKRFWKIPTGPCQKCEGEGSLDCAACDTTGRGLIIISREELHRMFTPELDWEGRPIL